VEESPTQKEQTQNTQTTGQYHATDIVRTPNLKLQWCRQKSPDLREGDDTSTRGGVGQGTDIDESKGCVLCVVWWGKGRGSKAYESKGITTKAADWRQWTKCGGFFSA
jgi:hypothetical protein